jgi:hypothetical protein
MTNLEKLKAEEDAARKVFTAAHIAWKKAHADAATAVYFDSTNYVTYSDSSYDAYVTAAAHATARAIAYDAHATAAEVYQAELNKAQAENDND